MLNESSARGVRSNSAGAVSSLCNRPGFAELFLVALLPDKEADSCRNQTNAVADGQAECVNLKNDLLEV